MVEKIKRKFTVNYSLARKITLRFIIILAFTLIAFLVANRLLLERFYLHSKALKLISVYDSINEASADNSLKSDEYDITLQHFCDKYSLGIIIISEGLEPFKIYSNGPDQALIDELNNNLRGFSTYTEMIEENASYKLVKSYDMRTGMEYMKLWGSLEDGSFFMIRTAIESMQESAEIARHFFIYAGIVVILAGSVIIWLTTRKIVKPILELAEISQKMANMDFAARYTGKSTTEVALLGENINKLSYTLEQTISELKAANNQLRKDIDEKNQIDEMRKEFVSNVSHELKTPIALIQGYAEGLAEGINEAEERDYYCNVIIDEADKMNVMVKQLLNLNQLEFGEQLLDIEHFDMNMLMKNYVQSADIIIKQNNIDVEFMDDEPIYVWADEFKIEEVFTNIFTNAIHHCDGERKVIKIYSESLGDKVKISVHNTGNPIPEEALEHLWEKFYKVDKAHSREYGGSGIGLSIVKAIIETHGEKCGVNNDSEGVTFWFTLDTVGR